VYLELKTLHVLAVIFLGGTIIVDALTGMTMPRLQTVAELRAITRLSRINQYLGITAAALVPIFGYLTANELSLSLTTGWVLVGQVLFYSAVGVGVFVLMPGALKTARRAAELPDGPIPEDVRKQMERPIFPVLGVVLTAVFVTIVYMMVAKPSL
jgi:uncharacterized membrane protein